MKNLRLFERIEQWDSRTISRSGNSPKRCIDSVIEHLHYVLNTRQGSTLMDPDFGIPDFSDLPASYPDCLSDLQRAVEKTIERYEPRLSEVYVEFVECDQQTLQLIFRIDAMLNTDGGMRNIFLESKMDASGRMLFRG